MNTEKIEEILNGIAYVRTGGSAAEKRAADFLEAECGKIGVEAWQETFPVQMAHMRRAELTVGGQEVGCRGYLNCGSGTVESELYYMPDTDPASLCGARGKIVLIDTGLSFFTYQDLKEAGAVGIITYDGNANYPNDDIDQKELRAYVHGNEKILSVSVNVKDAVKIVESGERTARIVIDQDEYEGESRNVIAFIPGQTDEEIILTAHYDSTSLSSGAYDNLTGCIGLLGIMEEMKRSAPHRYGLRFVFAGSEERGLLGSKAYAAAHKDELQKTVLNINLDMIGSTMGHFIACCTSEDKLVSFIGYLASVRGFGIRPYQGVYSSDSTPLADEGIPAVSFARIAGAAIAPIHCRYDTKSVVSCPRLAADMDFIVYFTGLMADAVKCPVRRGMPENMKKKLDEYLNRCRPENK